MTYNLKSSMVDRMNFDEQQTSEAIEAIAAMDRDYLMKEKAARIARDCWDEMKEYIAADDMCEAEARFLAVWGREIALAQEVA
jgi:hypothetical protein